MQTVGEIIEFLSEYPKEMEIKFFIDSIADSKEWLSDYTVVENDCSTIVCVDIGKE